MADNLTALANTGTGTDVLATDEIAGVHFPRTKITIGADGVNDGDVSASNPLPVSGTVTANAGTGTFAVSGPVTDAQLRATAVPVSISGTFEASADRTENLLAMLSRMVKLLESNAIVDQQQRQRITLDAIAASLTLAAVTTVTTVSTVSTVSSITNMAANAGMDREQYINIAKQTYAASIRSRLEFV